MTHKKKLRKIDHKLDRLKKGTPKQRRRYRAIERQLTKLSR